MRCGALESSRFPAWLKKATFVVETLGGLSAESVGVLVCKKTRLVSWFRCRRSQGETVADTRTQG